MGRAAFVVCLGATLSAAWLLSEPSLRPSTDPLWIAVVEGRGNLYPIARLDEGGWKVPAWVEPFEVEGVGALEEVELTPDGDGRWSWSGGLVTREVPTSWLLYTEEQAGTPLAITRGRLVSAHCVYKWALAVDGPAPGLSEGQFTGVALSRAPEAVLSKADMPGLNRIGEDLGLIDDPDRWSEGYRKFRWLGFLRVEGAVIGVLHGEYYEGETIRVVEIDGEVGRVLSRTHMGGC